VKGGRVLSIDPLTKGSHHVDEPNENMTENIHVKVSPQQKAEIRQVSRALRLTVSGAVRLAVAIGIEQLKTRLIENQSQTENE
jgi:hypothetical protein